MTGSRETTPREMPLREMQSRAAGPRIALVSRSFWPEADDNAAWATHTARAWHSAGLATTVLTTRGLPHWPEVYDHNGVMTFRILRPGRGWFAARALRRTLLDWFTTHRRSFDVAVVAGLQEDAAVVVEIARRLRFPVVLRVSQIGPGGECHQQMHTAAGMRVRRQCAQADALIASSDLAERELIAAGYPRDRIRLIPPGIELPPSRAALPPSAVRAALAAADPSLNLPAEAWLALHVLRPDNDDATRRLIGQWRSVIEHWPRSWLWLLGEPALQNRARRWCEDRNLLGRIWPVGVFDDVDDFYLAADALIEPGPIYDPPHGLLRAMAHELPVIAAVGDTHLERQTTPVIDNRTGRRIPLGNDEALLAAIGQMQQRPDWSCELGQHARQWIAQEYALAAATDAWRQLCQVLLRAG